MKKIIITLMVLSLVLSVFCSCKSDGKTENGQTSSESNTEQKTETSDQDMISAEELLQINSRVELLKNHKCYTVTEKIVSLDYEGVKYADGTIYATADNSFASCDIGDSTISYTDGTASEIDYNYFLCVVDGSVHKTDDYGAPLDSPEAEVKSCAKTDGGYDVEMITYQSGVVVYSSYNCDREFCEGDYVRYDLKLNDSYEILSYDSVYVPADGSDPVSFKTTEVEYDPELLPDFVNNIIASVSGEAHTVAIVLEDGSTAETTVFGTSFLLETDCEVYGDSECTEKIEPDEKYMYSRFHLTVTDDMTFYLKASVQQ